MGTRGQSGHGCEDPILAVSPVLLRGPLPSPANQHGFILCRPPGDRASAEGHSCCLLQKPCHRTCLCSAGWCVAQFLVGSPASKITDRFSFLLWEQFQEQRNKRPSRPGHSPRPQAQHLRWEERTGTRPSHCVPAGERVLRRPTGSSQLQF